MSLPIPVFLYNLPPSPGRGGQTVVLIDTTGTSLTARNARIIVEGPSTETLRVSNISGTLFQFTTSVQLLSTNYSYTALLVNDFGFAINQSSSVTIRSLGPMCPQAPPKTTTLSPGTTGLLPRTVYPYVTDTSFQTALVFPEETSLQFYYKVEGSASYVALPMSRSHSTYTIGLTGLIPQTTYKYFVSASNTDGTTNSQTQTFTTQMTGCPLTPLTGFTSLIPFAGSVVVTTTVDVPNFTTGTVSLIVETSEQTYEVATSIPIAGTYRASIESSGVVSAILKFQNALGFTYYPVLLNYHIYSQDVDGSLRRPFLPTSSYGSVVFQKDPQYIGDLRFEYVIQTSADPTFPLDQTVLTPFIVLPDGIDWTVGVSIVQVSNMYARIQVLSRGLTSFGPAAYFPTLVLPGPPSLTSATNTQIQLEFATNGIEGPASIQWGITPQLGSAVPATVVGVTATATISGLSPGTPYFFQSRVGGATSAERSFSTTSSTGPSGPPTVPQSVGTSTTSITVQFDVTGITGSPSPTYSINWGPTTALGTQVAATLSAGNIWTATVSGLTASTNYYFNSEASNSAGTQLSATSPAIQTGPPPPPPQQLTSIFVVDFLLYDGIQWVIDQQNIPDIGQWFLTGSQSGTIQANTGQSVIPYFKSLQAQGCKILVSFGGGGLTVDQLSVMFGNPQNVAASICYALLTDGVGTNPLGFGKAGTPWADFTFDGLDMDVEVNTPTPSDQYALLAAIHALVPSAILAAPPQAPNLISANPFGGNGNGSWYPFPHVYPGDTLALYNTAPSTSAWMYPPLMAQCGLDYIFVQFYNQGPSWYPGTPGTSFIPALAMWGWLCVESQAALGTGAKVIVGFGTNDANPIWNATTDGPALNSAIVSANALIVAQGGRYTAVTPAMWLAGWGAWNSPSANAAAVQAFQLSNMPNIATMLYTNNSGSPSLNPGWTGPISI